MEGAQPAAEGAGRSEPVRVDAPLGAQVAIVHTLVESVAAQVGVPVLHVKGPVAGAQLNIDRPTSTDVDILVPPSRRADLIDAMKAVGWSLGAADQAAKAGIAHAVVLLHPDWSCPVDVHDRFPGIEVPPAEAFEELWASRESITVAGVELHAPARLAHCLLILLHAARGAGGQTATTDIRLVRGALSPADTDTVVRLAAQLRASAALSATTPDLVPASADGRHIHWAVRSRNADGATLWASRFLAVHGLRARLAVLRTALFPGGFERRWLRRWARGVRDLPSALLTIRRLRQELAARRTAPTPASFAPLAPRATGPSHLPGHAPPPDSSLRREARTATVAFVEYEGDTWAAALPTGPLCRLVGTGRLIWEAARSRATIEEIVEDVASQVGVDPADVADDVAPFVAQLTALHLISQPLVD